MRVSLLKLRVRYNEIFFMTDTCQANTLYSKFYSPNILATGSSAKGQNSYSHHADSDIGVAVIDRFSHFALKFLEGVNKTSTATFEQFVRSGGAGVLGSHLRSV
jgi:phosphatidylinositol glycan class K